MVPTFVCAMALNFCDWDAARLDSLDSIAGRMSLCCMAFMEHTTENDKFQVLGVLKIHSKRDWASCGFLVCCLFSPGADQCAHRIWALQNKTLNADGENVLNDKLICSVHG